MTLYSQVIFSKRFLTLLPLPDQRGLSLPGKWVIQGGQGTKNGTPIYGVSPVPGKHFAGVEIER